jgi:hypothetical protein
MTPDDRDIFLLVRVINRRERRARALFFLILGALSWWVVLTMTCREDLAPRTDCPPDVARDDPNPNTH